MNFKWIGPLALLAALVIGDQIRINRPGHKYRLTVEVETPDGLKSGSSILAVTPDRGYSRKGHTATSGDAVFVDLGSGKNLVALLEHLDNGKPDPDAINYVALRAYNAAAGQRINFNYLNQVTGIVPVKGTQVPVLMTFGDATDPATARTVLPDNSEDTLGKGYRLRGITAEIVPNGFWPVDFGGFLGQPVTRGIKGKLPWIDRPESAAVALQSAGLPGEAAIQAREAFTRK